MSADAGRLSEMADELDQDDATSFTGDDAYEALGRLAEASARQLAAANHVRGGRPVKRRSLRA